MEDKIGVTERGDPAIDHSWMQWVKEGNAAILITKNCVAVEKLLWDLHSPNIIIHCGITGWGGTFLEPNVPKPKYTLKAYKLLNERFGPDRVVLRIDPIVVTLQGLIKALSVNSHKIGRVRISFLDAYEHVRKKLAENGIYIQKEFHAPIGIRREMWEALGCPDTCAEPGLPSSGCISEKDCEILRVKPRHILKGQRPLCSCLANKFELLTKKEPCPHGCLYCYWKGQ